MRNETQTSLFENGLIWFGTGLSIAEILTGGSDIAPHHAESRPGRTAGLVIIVFSTVTTTFPAVYSAGISSESLSKKINGKWVDVTIGICLLLSLFI